MKHFITALPLLLLWISSAAHALQALPTLNNISHVEISSDTLDTISITDIQKINQIVSFVNQYQSNWSIPEESRPEVSLIFSFFSNHEHIADIGISDQFISQLYGKRWSQPVAKNIMKQFAGSVHPAIEENLFPIIPVDANSQNQYSHWQKKLTQLETGSDYRKIKSFLRNNNIRIQHVNNPASSNGYWLNLKLSLVNDGDYVDTVIAAKMFLNKDHSLKSTQFLGYQLARKASHTKRITSNVDAAHY